MRSCNFKLLATSAVLCGLFSITFTAAAQTAPFVHTQAAGPVSATSATLNGMVVPNGLPTAAWFEWGARSGFGQTSAPVDVGSGSTVVRASAVIPGFTNGGQYQCRLVVSNSAGIAYGRMVFFTTGQKVLAWSWGLENNYGQTNAPTNLLTNVVGITAGRQHSLAILNDGSLVGWGRNDYGQSTVPAGLTNIVAAAASAYTSAAIRSDGSVFAWGDSRTNVPSGLTNAVAVAGGSAHLLGLRADGKVFAWGYNSDGQTNVPSTLSNVVAIAGGDYFSAALNANGTVTTWGYLPGSIPSGVTNVVSIAAGAGHCLALKADGKVVSWGYNAYGQTNVPASLSNVVAIAGGYNYSMALKADGDVVGWGLVTTTNAPGTLAKCVALVSGIEHNVELGNRAPRAYSQSFSGPANQDLVVSLSGSDINGDSFSFCLTSLPATGSLYQYVGGTRGALVSSPGTTVSDSLGRLIFVPATNGYGDPLASFTYVANDGDLDSAPATLTLQIIARPYAASQPPAGFTSNSLVLAGMVVPNGMPTSAWFEWGLSTNYGSTTSAIDVGAVTRVVRTTAPISGLTPGGIYHYRLIASNSAAVTYGANQVATTGSKVTAWGRNDSGQSVVPQGLNDVVAIDAGTDHSVALKVDGQVVAWGSNSAGQTNVPASLLNIVSIAAGVGHNLALSKDGMVTAWGLNSNSQTNVPLGLSNVVAVAAGGFHSVALRSDGTVALWGSASYGSTNVPEGLSNVVAISAGWYYSTALMADGTILSWGTPFYMETNVPAGLSDVVGIAAGWTHQMALRREAPLIGWGAGPTNVPAGLSNVTAIACGNAYNVAMSADGSLIAWGNNTYSQTNVPSKLSPAAGIACGLYHSLALANAPPQANALGVTGPANQDVVIGLSASDLNGDATTLRVATVPGVGTLYQYTSNGRGLPITSSQTVVTDPNGRLIFAPDTDQFGLPYASFNFVADDGTVDSAPATVTISITGTAYAATQPAAPVAATSAQLNGMALGNGLPTLAWFEWGTNSNYGQSSSPVSVASGSGAARVSLSLTNLLAGREYHFRIVVTNATRRVTGIDQSFKTGGKLTSWGLNTYNLTNIPAGLTNVVAVAGGVTHSLALQTDGTVKAWGGGDPVNGGSSATNVPLNLNNVVAISAGNYFSLGLLSNGTVAAWGGYQNAGSGSPVETNVPASLSNVVAIAAGGSHALALRSNGTVAAWGNNTWGQTNVPALSNIVAIAAGSVHSLALNIAGQVFAWGDTTVAPSSVTNVVAIAAGGLGSLALRSNGTAVAWGSGSAQLNVPAGLSNVVKIAAGGSHSLALKSDGTVMVWGSNTSKQTNAPSGLSNVVSITAGANHSLVIGGNMPPWVTNKTLTVYPNHDAVVTLSGGDANGDPLTFRITSLPARGSLYQYSSGGRGAAVMSPATSVTDGSARLVFAPAPDELGTPYTSFGGVAGDGDADSPPATVTLNVIQPPAPQMSVAKSGMARFSAPTLASAGLGLGSNVAFGLRFAGYSNLTYQVWASTNLVDWLSLGSASAASNGWFQFVDADSPNWPQRFYRLSQPGSQAFNLNFSGQPNATYRVWASTNLVNWELLGTANVTSNGWFQFLDFDNARWPQRFYRAGAP